MNGRAGAMIMIAIVLAGLRLAISPARSAPPESGDAKISSAEREASVGETSCDAFGESSGNNDSSGSANEINALVERYLYGVPKNTSLEPNAIPDGITFLVVTVPDPLHTHLSLQFDRTLEALQQALQDEKFTYDSSWLPWKKQSSDDQSAAQESSEEKTSALRERCPGLILFRRNMNTAHVDQAGRFVDEQDQNSPYEHGIFAFVVAETPTAGLNQTQWLNALSWIEKYSRRDRTDKTLRILGPTFSGSMPSIVRALAKVKTDTKSFTSALLYSGRIRGCGPWEWLNRELKAQDMLPIRTADFVENDAIQINRSYRFLTDRGHSLSEVAIISEDETAYGGLPDAKSSDVKPDVLTSFAGPECEPALEQTNRPVHLYYPRDISAIRSAYQEQSIFSSGSTTDPSKAPHTVLQPQYEPRIHGESDSIEPFSGQGMALTQEAQLYGIVNSLKTHAIRFVILRSTNSLDYLFLTRFLHRANPEVFIVTMGSDMLFTREIDSTEFRGVIALTTFPLLPRGQDWTQQDANLPQHAHRVFGSDIMEGVYLAARFLTTDNQPGSETACGGNLLTYTGRDRPHCIDRGKEDIPDYAPPFWDRNPMQAVPSTWLSVIGRDGYWPLAVLDTPHKELHSQALNLAHVIKPGGESGIKSEKILGGFTLSSSWKFTCFLAILAFSVHFLASRSGWKHQNLGVFVQFTPSSSNRQLILMAFGWGTVCSLLLLLFLASARIFPWLRGIDQGWVLVSGVFAAAGCAFFIVDLGFSRARRRKNTGTKIQKNHRRIVFWTGVALALIGISVAAGLFIFEFTNRNGALIAYRSVHLTSGISPVVSLLLILAGFYWWFWQSLSGLALLGSGRPILPRKARMPKELSRVSNEMALNIEASAMPIPRCRDQNEWFYVIPLLLVASQACILQRPWSQGFDSILHSLEDRSFNWILHGTLGISSYLLIIECCQLMLTWFALKRLLLALNCLPIRRTFAALQGLSMHSLWSMSGTSSRARYSIFSHQTESLVHLRNELDSFDGRDCGKSELRRVVRETVANGVRFMESKCIGADLAMFNDHDAHSIRRVYCHCAEWIIDDLLVPVWFAERESLDLAEIKYKGNQKEHLPLSEVSAAKLGEEFVCLIYVGYLQNMLARMRTMVLSMAGVFVAVALALAFYPYTPRPLLALLLLMLLLVLGVAVAVVYAGLDRDSTLSHITNTTPGTLGSAFWVRIVSFVGVPALGLIVAQFPGIADFVVSWIQPGMNAMK